MLPFEIQNRFFCATTSKKLSPWLTVPCTQMKVPLGVLLGTSNSKRTTRLCPGPTRYHTGSPGWKRTVWENVPLLKTSTTVQARPLSVVVWLLVDPEAIFAYAALGGQHPAGPDLRKPYRRRGQPNIPNIEVLALAHRKGLGYVLVILIGRDRQAICPHRQWHSEEIGLEAEAPRIISRLIDDIEAPKVLAAEQPHKREGWGSAPQRGARHRINDPAADRADRRREREHDVSGIVVLPLSDLEQWRQERLVCRPGRDRQLVCAWFQDRAEPLARS